MVSLLFGISLQADDSNLYQGFFTNIYNICLENVLTQIDHSYKESISKISTYSALLTNNEKHPISASGITSSEKEALSDLDIMSSLIVFDAISNDTTGGSQLSQKVDETGKSFWAINPNTSKAVQKKSLPINDKKQITQNKTHANATMNNGINCDCKDYIYLNDTGEDAVHKFVVESNGSLTEILNSNNSWYPGPNSSELPNPHGLGSDLNGFLYIAEQSSGDIRKLRCDGEILPTTTFEIENVGGFNILTLGNLIFTNDPAVNNEVEVFNTCSGMSEGTICFDGQTYNWGLYISPYDETIYATSAFGNRAIYKATVDDINGACVQPFLTTQGSGVMPNIGDNFLPHSGGAANIQGITTDELGNIYFVLGQPFSNSITPTTLYKYSPAGILLAISEVDSDNEDGSDEKFSRALGIVYSEQTGRLYTSNGTSSINEDCISIFDTDLNYIGTGFPNPSGASSNQLGKGIGIRSECCPVSNNIIIDTTLCAASINDKLSLQELINCNGPICEGTWQEDISNAGLTYDSCDNSVTINALDACGSFILESNGTGTSSQCGAFQITVNISINNVTAAVIEANQSICDGGDPAPFTVTTAAMGGTLTHQWQISTTDCTTGFSNILGANSSTYDAPAGLTTTSYYRVITNSDNTNCSIGMCADTSNCITVIVNPNPTATASTTDATCSGSTVNADGTITLAGFSAGDRFDFTTGNTYTGSATFASGSTVIPVDGIIANNLANGTQDYTIRIFNANGCTVDRIVSLNETNCGCINPTASIFAIQPSCIDGMIQSDGYLQISAFSDADKIGFSLGNAYSGATDFNDPALVTIDSLPFQFNTGLANPTGTQDYTIRLFNGASGCFADLVVTMNEQDCTIGCNCTEMLYINEPTFGLGQIHKFSINPDSSLTEINPIGSWYPNGGVSEVPRPHGIVGDLNGNIYVAESNVGSEQDVRKIDCDGNIFPESEFVLPEGNVTHMASYKNYLFTNGIGPDGGGNTLQIYDLCTQDRIREVCFTDADGNATGLGWGMTYDYTNDLIYASAKRNQEGAIFIIDPKDPNLYTSTDCIAPAFSGTSTNPLRGDRVVFYGVAVAPQTGDVYLVRSNSLQSDSKIARYDAAGNFITETALDSTNGNGGWYGSGDIVYSETCNCLISISSSNTEDCAYSWNLDLTPRGPVIDPSGSLAGNDNGLLAKAASTTQECCPTNNNIQVDTTLCSASIDDVLLLQELINCNGSICEGMWIEGINNSGLTYNSCNNSVSIDSLTACGSFTLESDGTGTNPQCGAFKITVNISVNNVTAAVIEADQSICAGGDPAPFIVTAAASGGTLTHQWQVSTTDCTTDFADIPGANSSTYDAPAGLTATSYYRVIANSNNAGCSTGMCADTSNCITVTVNPNPTTTASVTNATCTGSTVNADGTITLAGFRRPSLWMELLPIT